MTRANKTEAVWNELTRAGIEWDADISDIVDREIRTCDGKDTARQIAKRVILDVRAA